MAKAQSIMIRMKMIPRRSVSTTIMMEKRTRSTMIITIGTHMASMERIMIKMETITKRSTISIMGTTIMMVTKTRNVMIIAIGTLMASVERIVIKMEKTTKNSAIIIIVGTTHMENMVITTMTTPRNITIGTTHTVNMESMTITKGKIVISIMAGIIHITKIRDLRIMVVSIIKTITTMKGWSVTARVKTLSQIVPTHSMTKMVVMHQLQTCVKTQTSTCNWQ